MIVNFNIYIEDNSDEQKTIRIDVKNIDSKSEYLIMSRIFLENDNVWALKNLDNETIFASDFKSVLKEAFEQIIFEKMDLIVKLLLKDS